MRKGLAIAAILPALLVVALLYVSDIQAQAGLTNFTSLGVSQDLTVGDDATVGNTLTVEDFFNITAQNTLTLTMNGWLTPTGSLQPIASVGAVSINGGTRIAHVADMLMVANVGTQTITISETTGLVSAGNIVLGAGDTALLVWTGSGWHQMSGSNN